MTWTDTAVGITWWCMFFYALLISTTYAVTVLLSDVLGWGILLGILMVGSLIASYFWESKQGGYGMDSHKPDPNLRFMITMFGNAMVMLLGAMFISPAFQDISVFALVIYPILLVGGGIWIWGFIQWIALGED